MTLGYAILLDHTVHNFVRAVQLELHQALGVRLARQTPHITIKSPFETDTIEGHISYLEDLAARIAPFELAFNGFGSFGDKVLFLDVKESPTLLDLHHGILRDVKTRFGLSPHAFEGPNIKFHTSIAGFDTSEGFQQARDLLTPYQPSYTFQARELGLFYYLGEGNGWIINRRVRVGDGKSGH
ncbi:hypothetical protein LEM8419_01914 [Neolewinella maritima]|uniref:2'-5' RNA ligase family protein n=1 Tax=Neolewinella maritima TaxID=1383882 RepID=A0ABM9B148_9BACT|nr:2'-5' RNA ligase family protein [Neolewinella maritima]CAH1000846.1 hypothetical protein LEM8419_01914 [Neolewinella maritima]